MAIDNDLLLAAIDFGRSRSYGSDHNSEIGRRRAEVIEAYLGLNTNPAPEGRSQVVDRTVYQVISTLMPSLVRIFANSSDDIVKFIPVGPEDEPGADQTTAAIAHVVTQENHWEQICGDWLLDAMLSPTAYAIAYWDDSETLTRERYEGQSDDQLAALMADPGVKVLQHSESVDEEATKEAQQAYQQVLQQWQMTMMQWQQAAQMAQAQGQPVPPQPPQPQPPQPIMQHDVLIEREESEGKVCIKVLSPEYCYVAIDTPDWTLTQCPYFEYRTQKSLHELRSMGLEVPDDISDDEEPNVYEDWARDRFDETQNMFGEEEPGANRQVWTRMIWLRADVEGDGKSRLYYVIAVGREILFAEPCARIPVASMTMQPLPHRHPGMSVGETILDMQEVRTAVKRGGLDNLYLLNSGRNVISDKVNLADMLDSRPGGVVRLLDGAMPSEGHVQPLVHPVAFDQIISSLEYFDQESQNRTGASRYFAGTDAGAINKTASGTMALQNAASMRVEHYARVIAPAIETLFSIVHELVSKHKNKPLTMKLKGRWVTVDPQAWRTKRDVRISVGVGAGNKESMQQHLQMVLANQMQIGLPMGLVEPRNIRETNVEILKLAGFSNPDKFWPDPQSIQPKPPPPSPEQIKAQTEQAKMQFQAQQDQMRFQAEQQSEQQRMQLQAQVDSQREEMQARQKQLELQQHAELERLRAEYQAAQEQRRLEFEQWKASLDASVKLEIANKSAQTAMDTAQPKPDPQVGQVVEMLQQFMEEASQPAEIVRDPNTGRAVGIKRGNKVRSIVRGPDGRAVGVQ
jgi:hypothetical protein